MLARPVICRLAAAEGPKTSTSTQSLPRLARFVHQRLLRSNAIPVSAVRALAIVHSRRAYATTTARATKTPAATAKNTVKSAAAKKATSRKTAVAKKPVARSRTKAAANKAAPKKKKKETAKKAVKPKPAVKKVKKVLSPEEKTKLRIKELKVAALRDPVSTRSVTPYNAFVADKAKATSGPGSKDAWNNMGQNYKNLTAAEREHYNHIANEINTARQAEYKAWVLSHTPSQIRAANSARRRLVKLMLPKKAPAAYTRPIVDDRQPARPLPPYIHFFRARSSSGDLKGIPVVEASKLLGEEWKNLSESEKQKYYALFMDQQAQFQKGLERISAD